MNENYEEWMKMATDNVSVFCSHLSGLTRPIENQCNQHLEFRPH